MADFDLKAIWRDKNARVALLAGGAVIGVAALLQLARGGGGSAPPSAPIVETPGGLENDDAPASDDTIMSAVEELLAGYQEAVAAELAGVYEQITAVSEESASSLETLATDLYDALAGISFAYGEDYGAGDWTGDSWSGWSGDAAWDDWSNSEDEEEDADDDVAARGKGRGLWGARTFKERVQGVLPRTTAPTTPVSPVRPRGLSPRLTARAVSLIPRQGPVQPRIPLARAATVTSAVQNRSVVAPRPRGDVSQGADTGRPTRPTAPVTTPLPKTTGADRGRPARPVSPSIPSVRSITPSVITPKTPPRPVRLP